MTSNDKVSRNEIKEAVINELEPFAESGQPVTEDMHLQKDLDLGPSSRFALALPFTKISKHYDGYAIRGEETKMLGFVKEAVDLVFKKANRSN